MTGNGLHLDDSILERIAKLAREVGSTGEEVVRRAVRHYERVVSRFDARRASTQSLYERAGRQGFVRCLNDAPPDLSTNKDYFTGFGRG